MPFIINHKKEFLVTYPTDYLGHLKIEDIKELFSISKDWLFIIAEEKGHKKGHIHNHFHVYLRYVGPNKNGFSKRGANAERIWDIPLGTILYEYKKINNENNEIEIHYSNEPQELCKLIASAHPNIKFKGDKQDKNCKNTYSMMDYVTKQRKDFPKEEWKIISNFNWEDEIDSFEKIIELGLGKNESKEFQFTSWLRLQIVEYKKTPDEIKYEITKNPELFHIYLKRKNSYDSAIYEFCKIRDAQKPKPDWEKKYIIPAILKKMIDYIDNWVKLWYEAPENDKGIKQGLPERPRGIWMTSKSRSGKTNIAISLGPFNYFNSMWNLLNYSYNNPINIMDDFSGKLDTNDFTKIKPWVGAQYTFTVCDKFKPKENITNGKPLIWLSNIPFEEQVLEERDREYVKANMEVIPLGQYDLYSPKDTRTIGAYTSWVNWDPKSTWYYNNIVKKLENNNDNENNASTSENTEEEQSTAQLLQDETAEITVISDEEIPEEEIPEITQEENYVYTEDLPGYEYEKENIGKGKGRPINQLIEEIQASTSRNKRRRRKY